MIANYQTRTPQLFKHRVEAKLKTKLSETNPGKMNIGFSFVQSVVNVENLSSIGKTINEHLSLPKYIELQNPHPTEVDLLKKMFDIGQLTLICQITIMRIMIYSL